MVGVSVSSVQDGAMTKYDPLRRFLSRQKTQTLTLSFAEMESLIGRLLPKGASHPDWWADAVDTERRPSQKEAWREAGFAAVLLQGQDRVQFDRRVSL